MEVLIKMHPRQGPSLWRLSVHLARPEVSLEPSWCMAMKEPWGWLWARSDGNRWESMGVFWEFHGILVGFWWDFNGIIMSVDHLFTQKHGN